jgi:hypothetical protein
MIIVRLNGGLGNQLFQYAVGRQLAAKRQAILKLDIFDLKISKSRKYALDQFKIKAEYANSKEIARFKPPIQLFINRVIWNKLFQKPAEGYIMESQYHFAPEILALPDDVYLDGYWQSYKYFAEIDAEIRQELTLKAAPTGKNKEVAEAIAGCEAIALHIRRGDYVTNKAADEILGVQPISYYESAIAHIVKQVKNPHFFIFSDDPTWVKENLKPDYPTTYVGHNDGDHGYEDLRLMNGCKHFIIANSSFSWWGAWLAYNPKKIVIAPKRWFRDQSINTNDLIPESWIRL